jgi:hypothetical protein
LASALDLPPPKVAALPVKQQEQFLDRAEAEDMTRAKLRKAVFNGQ